MVASGDPGSGDGLLEVRRAAPVYRRGAAGLWLSAAVATWECIGLREAWGQDSSMEVQAWPQMGLRPWLSLPSPGVGHMGQWLGAGRGRMHTGGSLACAVPPGTFFLSPASCPPPWLGLTILLAAAARWAQDSGRGLTSS